MKINLNKIPEEVLGDIRQNAGAKDEDDTSHDAILAAESPRQLLKRYAEWHLGDGGWGTRMVDVHEALKRAER